MAPVNSTQNMSQGDQATALIAELSKLTPDAINNDQAERFKALELSKKLIAKLEDPVDRATELVFRVFTRKPPLMQEVCSSLSSHSSQ